MPSASVMVRVIGGGATGGAGSGRAASCRDGLRLARPAGRNAPPDACPWAGAGRHAGPLRVWPGRGGRPGAGRAATAAAAVRPAWRASACTAEAAAVGRPRTGRRRCRAWRPAGAASRGGGWRRRPLGRGQRRRLRRRLPGSSTRSRMLGGTNAAGGGRARGARRLRLQGRGKRAFGFRLAAAAGASTPAGSAARDRRPGGSASTSTSAGRRRRRRSATSCDGLVALWRGVGGAGAGGLTVLESAAAAGSGGRGGLGRLGRRLALLAERAVLALADFTAASEKMSPLGSSMPRCRARRSTNWRATISSRVLDALFSSMPWFFLSRSSTSWLVVPNSSATL